MILGDSLLVMTSLAEKEGLKGKVQTIYFDPPYGIKFGIELAGQHAQARREGRQGRGRDAAAGADPGVPRHVEAGHPLVPGLPARSADRCAGTADRERAASSCRSATRMCTSCRALLDEVFGSENFCAHHHGSEDTGRSYAVGTNFWRRSLTTCSGTRRTSSSVKYRQLYREKATRSRRLAIDGCAWPTVSRRAERSLRRAAMSRCPQARESTSRTTSLHRRPALKADYSFRRRVRRPDVSPGEGRLEDESRRA